MKQIARDPDGEKSVNQGFRNRTQRPRHNPPAHHHHREHSGEGHDAELPPSGDTRSELNPHVMMRNEIRASSAWQYKL